MKILQVNNYGYLKGGSEKVFFETINVLEQHGHQVKAFCMRNNNDVILNNLVSVPITLYEDRKGISGNISAIKNFFYNHKVEKEFSKLLR